MKLIFWDDKSIAYVKKQSKSIKSRKRRFKRSGLSMAAFEAREELKYWGCYNPKIFRKSNP